MTKASITNQIPKPGVSPASQIALTVAMELGRVLGRREAKSGEDVPDKGREPLANRYKLPKAGELGSKAAEAGGKKSGYRLPKAEA